MREREILHIAYMTDDLRIEYNIYSKAIEIYSFFYRFNRHDGLI